MAARARRVQIDGGSQALARRRRAPASTSAQSSQNMRWGSLPSARPAAIGLGWGKWGQSTIHALSRHSQQVRSRAGSLQNGQVPSSRSAADRSDSSRCAALMPLRFSVWQRGSAIHEIFTACAVSSRPFRSNEHATIMDGARSAKRCVCIADPYFVRQQRSFCTRSPSRRATRGVQGRGNSRDVG